MGSYLLQTYATNDVIAETDAAWKSYTQPYTMTPTQYAKALVPKSLKFAEVYEEYV